MFLVDSHCHLDMLELGDDPKGVDNVLVRASDLGVKYFLNVCVSLKDFSKVLSAAEHYTNVSASVGLHPNHDDEEVDEATLITLAAHPKIVAIGETGLDYYRSSGDLDWQRDRFRTHIRAAKKLNKPLIIHTRDAKQDTIQIMQEEGAHEVGGVMHCFTEDWEMAQAAMAMNFYISFSGIVTFNNAKSIQAVAKQVPLDKLLLETDSPYLAPVPKRGKPNEPGYTRYTADFVANLRGIEVAELAKATTNNFFNLFTEAKRPDV